MLGIFESCRTNEWHSWQSRRIDNGEYLIFHQCNNLPVKSMKAHNYFNKRYVFLVVSLQQYKLSIWRMNTVNEIAKWKKKPNVYQFLENVTLINHCLDSDFSYNFPRLMVSLPFLSCLTRVFSRIWTWVVYFFNISFPLQVILFFWFKSLFGLGNFLH